MCKFGVCGPIFIIATEPAITTVGKTKRVKINGKVCPDEKIIVVGEGCTQGFPKFDSDGQVCMNQGKPTQAYCSFDISPKTCAYCKPDPTTVPPPTVKPVTTTVLGAPPVGGAKPKQCSASSSDAGCCTSAGRFATTEVKCVKNGQQGYCNAGKCSTAFCRINLTWRGELKRLDHTCGVSKEGMCAYSCGVSTTGECFDTRGFTGGMRKTHVYIIHAYIHTYMHTYTVIIIICTLTTNQESNLVFDFDM